MILQCVSALQARQLQLYPHFAGRIHSCVSFPRGRWFSCGLSGPRRQSMSTERDCSLIAVHSDCHFFHSTTLRKCSEGTGDKNHGKGFQSFSLDSPRGEGGTIRSVRLFRFSFIPPSRWGGTGGSEHPASRTLHSRFPPPSIAAPASVYFSYCEILCQCCEIFPISPGSRPF